MCHLKTSSFEATLDIEAFVGLTAVKYTFVATNFFSNKIQSLNDSQSKFLSLLILVNSNIFDVTNKSHVVYEFAFDDDCSRTYNLGLRVANNKDVVCVVSWSHKVVSFVKGWLRRFTNSCQNSQAIEISFIVSKNLRADFVLTGGIVAPSKRSNSVSHFLKTCFHCWRYEIVWEQILLIAIDTDGAFGSAWHIAIRCDLHNLSRCLKVCHCVWIVDVGIGTLSFEMCK